MTHGGPANAVGNGGNRHGANPSLRDQSWQNGGVVVDKATTHWGTCGATEGLPCTCIARLYKEREHLRHELRQVDGEIETAEHLLMGD